MRQPRNIFLAGFMGSGKTVVGRAMARNLGWRFADTDQEIERRAGKSVSALFADKGEPWLRSLERRVVRALAKGSRRVVALGGGALLDAGNRRALSGSGLLVRLSCAEPELWRRLRSDLGLRPLLSGERPRRSLRLLLRQRRAAYRGADMTVSTTHRSPAEAAREIVRRLSNVFPKDAINLRNPKLGLPARAGKPAILDAA